MTTKYTWDTQSTEYSLYPKYRWGWAAARIQEASLQPLMQPPTPPSASHPRQAKKAHSCPPRPPALHQACADSGHLPSSSSSCLVLLTPWSWGGGAGGGWYTIEMNKTKAFAQHRTLEVWPFQWPVYQPKRINPLPFFPLALNSMLEFTLLQWTVWFLALQSVSFPSHNYGIVSLAGHLEASTERLCWHTPLSTNGLLTCALATFFFLSLK